jgi:hypothetical protein
MVPVDGRRTCTGMCSLHCEHATGLDGVTAGREFRRPAMPIRCASVGLAPSSALCCISKF